MPTHVYWAFQCAYCAHKHDYAYLGVYGEVSLMGIPPSTAVPVPVPEMRHTPHLYSGGSDF